MASFLLLNAFSTSVDREATPDPTNRQRRVAEPGRYARAMTEVNVVLVVTVTDDRAVAETLAHAAVESRVAACVQVSGPVSSVYRWQGAIETAEEWQVSAKTTEAKADELVSLWRSHHPYEVPEILVTPVLGGNLDYLAWVSTETTD